jgi:hypothetical protein
MAASVTMRPCFSRIGRRSIVQNGVILGAADPPHLLD